MSYNHSHDENGVVIFAEADYVVIYVYMVMDIVKLVVQVCDNFEL